MRRDELIVELYEQENQRLLELSQDTLENKPKGGCGAKWKECKERLDVLQQMLQEIPMDCIESNKETGLTRQIFIGTIEDGFELSFDCKDSNKRYYYIKMTIRAFGDEKFYRDVRLLRLSYKAWWEWFFNLKYEDEKQLRIKKNMCTYIQATVVDGQITKLKWYKRYNTKKYIGAYY